jgi:hypothetical protein
MLIINRINPRPPRDPFPWKSLGYLALYTGLIILTIKEGFIDKSYRFSRYAPLMTGSNAEIAASFVIAFLTLLLIYCGYVLYRWYRDGTAED